MQLQMPFWSDSKTQNYKAKLEHKMCIAKEAPDSNFDLSDCNLSEIPSGVFSMCRVFRKEALILENNQITNLSAGGSLKDLSQLLVLNFESNRLSNLPEQISYLSNLQELNLKNNLLRKLPSSFGNLENLQHLNLKGNKFTHFPMPVCSLTKLQTLNICDNPKIKVLPDELSNLTSLNLLQLDIDKYSYPSSDVCSEGTETIMKFLCAQIGKEYQSPQLVAENKCYENICQDSPVTKSADSSEISDRRHQELLLLEKEMKENFVAQSNMTVDSNLRRKKLLDNMAKEQNRIDAEILFLQSRKDIERKGLLNDLSNVENHSAELITRLININNRRKQLAEMSAMLEKDKLENEEMFSIKQEELEQLRKKEILVAMTEMLQQEDLRGKYEAAKFSVVEQLQNDENESNLKLFNIFQERELDQQILMNKVLEEEQFQKEAFEVLQLQKDIQHQEIAHQIHLIEKELSSLTTAEIKKKDLKINSDLNVLADHRIALACLLAELLTAKQEREKELKELLIEMESKRVEEIENFWLIQYQKLLDRKPKSVIDEESNLDVHVKNILLDASAEEFIPIFATKKINFYQLLDFTVKDLKKVGVLDDNTCGNILSKVQEYIECDKKLSPLSDDTAPEPSAPPEEPIELLEPSAPPLSPESEGQLWCQAECVICLDAQTSTAFLPCGHVCCCQNCSKEMELCPLCRTVITSKFALTIS